MAMTIPYKTILQSAFLTVLTLFVPAAFLIAGISAWAIGRGLRDNTLDDLEIYKPCENERS